MKKYLFFAFLLSSIFAFGQQQNVTFDKKNFQDNIPAYTKAIDSMNYGDALYFDKRSSNDYLALPYYMTAERFNPNNDELNYKIGCVKLSHNSQFKLDALGYLLKAYTLNPHVAADIHYYLGRAYHLRASWDTAKMEYSTYLATLKEGKNAKEIEDTKKKIEECNNGILLMQNPLKVQIDNVGPNINTPYPEYGVLVNADETEMIFTSKRPETTGKGVDYGSSQYTEDIYISHFMNGAWTPATNTNTALNTEDNDATAGISLDGKTLYIYRGAEGGDLYVTHLTGDTNWSKPVEMSNKLNSKYFETSVCVAPDGRIIYFVSERPGGFGGRDIYEIQIDTLGNWGEAQNLGSKINTKYNEEGIAVHPDGQTIYFSSEGHNSMGGYDVFKAQYNGSINKPLDTKKWGEPVNIGWPINTPDDDVFFCISGNGKHAYYSSEREGGQGEKDIYRITFLTEPKPLPKIAKSKMIKVKGVIVDSDSHKKLEAEVEIRDSKTHKVIAHFKSNGTTGEYHVEVPSGTNYELSVNADGYAPFSDNIDVSDMEKATDVNEKTIALQSLKVGATFTFNNIGYGFNKANLFQSAIEELDNVVNIMKSHPSIKFSISSYTDNVGSTEYNLTLSERRSKAVVTYITSHGVDGNRLTSKGFGKADPIASNKTKAGRRKNRRTEFKVIAN